MAFTLLIPLRNIFLSPKQLINRLSLAPDHQVLEVGSGPGYFSPSVAQAIPLGKLVLADIQQEMLLKAKKRLERKKIQNVNYFQCDGDHFDFPDESFDRIFLVTVIGEVENKEAYMLEFYRLLKPKGILSISELAGDPDKITSSDLKTLASKANFEPIQFFGTEKNYTLNFKKKC